MTVAALEALVREQRALIAALDSDDVDGITRHTGAVQDLLVRIRALGSRFTSDEARRLATEAMTLTDAARVRINVLADMTSRRLNRLAEAGGKQVAAPVYGRTGRLGR